MPHEASTSTKLFAWCRCLSDFNRFDHAGCPSKMLSCIGESSPAGQADTAALPFVFERGAVRLKEFVLTALVSLVYCIPRVQRQAIHSRVHAWFWFDLNILLQALHIELCLPSTHGLVMTIASWSSWDGARVLDLWTLILLGSTSSTHLGTQSRSNLLLPFTSYWNLWPTEAGSVSGFASFVLDLYPCSSKMFNVHWKDAACHIFVFFTCIARPYKTAVYDKLCMVMYCICIAYALHMFESHNSATEQRPRWTLAAFSLLASI